MTVLEKASREFAVAQHGNKVFMFEATGGGLRLMSRDELN